MKNFGFVLTALFFVFMTSCQQEDVAPESDFDTKGVVGENFTFYTSKDRFNEIVKTRSGDESGAFEIVSLEQVDREGKPHLKIVVSHSLCNPEPEFIWDGSVAESYPPQVFVLLQLADTGGCSDPQEVSDTYYLDIKDYFGEDLVRQNAMFRVMNASKIDTAGDPHKGVNVPLPNADDAPDGGGNKDGGEEPERGQQSGQVEPSHEGEGARDLPAYPGGDGE